MFGGQVFNGVDYTVEIRPDESGLVRERVSGKPVKEITSRNAARFRRDMEQMIDDFAMTVEPANWPRAAEGGR